jgi:hypothetical protein
MPTAHLVHGFNVTDGGANTTDKLRPHFEARGYHVEEHDTTWGWSLIANLISVRMGNEKRAAALAQKIQTGDLLVGHSNGCLLISMACWMLAQLEETQGVRVVLFNPAMDVDTPLSPVISRALVFHTKSDRTVWSAKLLRGHRWGEAGRVGLRGISSYKIHNCAYETLGFEDLKHSGIFADEKALNSALRAFDDFMEETA